MIVEWPSVRLAPRIYDLHLANQTRSAGESINGFEQVAESITARWRCSIEFPILRPSAVPAWRAMIAKLRGRANVLRVPVWDRRFWPSDAAIGFGSAPHSDGSEFSDGTEYTSTDVEGITATGLRGVKSLTVDFGSYGQLMDGGLYFGINDETYLATGVEWDGTEAAITFEPGLRQDHTAGTFRLRPFLLMRLADDEQGRLALTRGIIGQPTLELVEILPDELALLEGGE